MIKGERYLALALAILVIVAGLFLATRLHVTSDMGVFLPRDQSTLASKILLSQLDKGATANTVFARVSGAGPDRLAELSKGLAEQWAQSDMVERVLNGSEILKTADLEFIERYRYLITPGKREDPFSIDGLKASLGDRLDGLGSALASLEKRYLRKDPSGQLMSLLENWQTKKARTTGPEKYNGVWFSRDQSSAILAIQTRTKGMDLDSHEASSRFLYESFSTLASGNESMDLTGAGAFAVETRDVIRSDVGMLSVLAVAFVGFFLALVFRSVVLVALLFVPLFAAVCVAAAAVQLVFGQVHGITLAFGVTLIGVAIDYPIHFIAHLDARSSAWQHVRRIWPTLRLGVLTTIIAYLFLTFSSFEGLQQLGVFTIAGLLTAAAVTRWVLPIIVPRGLEVRHNLEGLHNLLERAGRGASRWRLPATLVVLAAGVYLLATDRPLRDFHVDVLSPISKERRLAARGVRDDLSMWAGGKMFVVVGSDVEEVLQISESLVEPVEKAVAGGVLRDYDMAAQFLPSAKVQLSRRDALPGPVELRERLNTAMADFPFREGTFDPYLDDVERSRTLEPLTLDDLADRGAATHLKPLLVRNDDRWLAPVLLHNVQDDAALTAIAEGYSDDSVLYLSIKDETSALMRRVIDRMAWLLALGTLCIYAVLAIAFRDIRRPLRILLPTVASVVTVSAILVLAGVALNLFHLTALLLVVGLGLDYSLFFSRLSDNEGEWRSTFRSLWICCFTTVLVFGLLIISETPPLNSVGETAAIGAALSLIYGAIWSSAWGEGRGLLGLDRKSSDG